MTVDFREPIRKALRSQCRAVVWPACIFLPNVHPCAAPKLLAKRNRHRAYMRNWIRNNPERQKSYRDGFTRRNKGTSLTLRNRRQMGAAIKRWVRWSPEEDALLFTGKQKDLATRLGRTLRSIERRRHELRRKVQS